MYIYLYIISYNDRNKSITNCKYHIYVYVKLIMASLINIPRFTLKSNDLHSYLQGVWKRNLEWRSFGGAYQHIQATNVVVVIDNVKDRNKKNDNNIKHNNDEGPSYLDWSFTFKQSINAEKLVFGYRMKCIPDKQGTYMVSI